MDSLAYSSKQVELLLEATKVLLPVCTGFVLLAANSLHRFEQQKLLASQSLRFIMILCFALSILSIGLWSGVLAFMVDCSHPFDRVEPLSTLRISITTLNWEWDLGQLCAEVALISFFASVATYCLLAYKLLNRIRSKVRSGPDEAGAKPLSSTDYTDSTRRSV